MVVRAAAAARVPAASRRPGWLSRLSRPAWLRGDDESHYVGVSVDGAPGIVTFVVDGVLCDGAPFPSFSAGDLGAGSTK